VAGSQQVAAWCQGYACELSALRAWCAQAAGSSSRAQWVAMQAISVTSGAVLVTAYTDALLAVALLPAC
jgi:hypothetical protein